MWVLFIIVVVVVWIYFSIQADKKKEIWDAQQRERLSLTCGDCGGLAAPILHTDNRYKCPKCGKQFSGASHGY